MTAPESRRAIGRSLLVLALTVAASCARQIPRDDWGAITSDAQIVITTVDGDRYRLGGVTVFEDALEGVDLEAADSPSVRFALDQVEYLEASRNLVGPIFAVVASAAATVAIIAAMSKSNVRPAPTAVVNSCPFVYSFDGSGYTLDSETYAGAITRGVQRTDVDNLEHVRPVDGEYHLLLTNERPETQYTDALRLVAIDHPVGSSVYPDVTGLPRIFIGGRAPTSATTLRGTDARLDVAEADGRFWTGDPVETANLDVPSDLRDGIVLSFPRPEGAVALLAVRAQNTELAPFALKTFLELQGEGLVSWYRRVDHQPELREKLGGWVMREGTLHVSVWIDGAWQLQSMLLDVGPHLPKTQVTTLDLSGVDGDEVRIRVESARGLWTLDWVSLGREGGSELSLTELAMTRATTGAGRDLRAELASVDGSYFTALEGDRVELTFEAPPPPAPGELRTVLVRSTGFYHIYTDPTQPPQPEVADRILSEPLFGNRYMLARLREMEAEDPDLR